MITAIIKVTEQVGPSDWHTSRFTRNFDESRSIQDILSWAKNMNLGFTPTINSIELAEHTGDSI